MAITINISGTVIDIPSSGASPNWAPALIEFIQAVEGALESVAGPFDVPPQVQSIAAYNPGTDIELQSATFPTSDVRSVELIYSVFRETSSANVTETGTIKAVYNPNNPPGNQWEVGRGLVLGDAKINFTFLDNGQVTFTTEALAGTGHSGTITFQAKALLQSA